MSELVLDRAQVSGALPGLLEIDDVAALLRISRSLLAKWRMVGKGPRFTKVGRRILYETTEVSIWLKAQRRSCTVD